MSVLRNVPSQRSNPPRLRREQARLSRPPAVSFTSRSPDRPTLREKIEGRIKVTFEALLDWLVAWIGSGCDSGRAETCARGRMSARS
jgi:hypothetical protein